MSGLRTSVAIVNDWRRRMKSQRIKESLAEPPARRQRCGWKQNRTVTVTIACLHRAINNASTRVNVYPSRVPLTQIILFVK